MLLYDGTCGVCAKSVQWVLRHERSSRTHRSLRFASLQGPLAQRVIAAHAELRGVDSVIWYEPATDTEAERILVRSSAVIAVGRYLGGVWRMLAAIGSVVPRPVRDGAYDFIARHRYSIAGMAPACLVPSPEQRARFVE